MRQRRLISTGVASLLCGLAALATLALGAPKDPKPGNGPPSQVPPGNGQVDITLSKTSDVLDLSNAVIGDTKSGSVTVGNGGKQAADFTLTGDLVIPVTSPGADALADQMQLQVSKTAGAATTQLYSGSITGFNAAGALPLGIIYPPHGPKQPKSVTLNFELSFPSTGTDAGDNALQDLGPIDQRFVIHALKSTGSSNNNGNGPPANVPNNNKPKSADAGIATIDSPAPALTPTSQLAPAPTTGRTTGPRSSKRVTSEPTTKKRAKKKVKRMRGRKVKTKRASSSESIGGKLRGNGAALALLALAAALLLSLTLPPRGRSRS